MTLSESVPHASPAPAAREGTALLLTGGGARAAYQVGVLQGILELQQHARPEHRQNPFQIVVGTSAGAINATALACWADDFAQSAARLAQIWGNFHAEQVYHASALHAMSAGVRWAAFMTFGWLSNTRARALQPHSLLDNSPLRDLLEQQLPFERVWQMLEERWLRALAVTTSCYTTGEHVSFYDSIADIDDWERVRRRASRVRIGVPHLMASAAIPLLFPAIRVRANGHVGWYGDGSMRQMAPLSPLVHLGARRILVIGVARALEATDAPAGDDPGYPSFAQVANHALASIFQDTLAADAERLTRINHTLSLLTPEQSRQTHLRPIELLTITPSQRVDLIAARHTRSLPRPVRTLMGMLGMRGGRASARSSALASYLLFEAGFTRELMALGHADAMAQANDISTFLGWSATQDPAAPGRVELS